MSKSRKYLSCLECTDNSHRVVCHILRKTDDAIDDVLAWLRCLEFSISAMPGSSLRLHFMPLKFSHHMTCICLVISCTWNVEYSLQSRCENTKIRKYENTKMNERTSTACTYVWLSWDAEGSSSKGRIDRQPQKAL